MKKIGIKNPYPIASNFILRILLSFRFMFEMISPAKKLPSIISIPNFSARNIKSRRMAKDPLIPICMCDLYFNVFKISAIFEFDGIFLIDLLIMIAAANIKNITNISAVNLFFSLYSENIVIAISVRKSAIKALYSSVCLYANFRSSRDLRVGKTIATDVVENIRDR